MDINDRLLSHQVEIVNRLSLCYDHVYVVTGRIGEYKCPSNVTVISSGWIADARVSSALKFLKVAVLLLVKRKPIAIFSHMTEVQTALLAPISKIFKVPHVLWYAHAHKSIFLRWSNIWVSAIVTSTEGSCPIRNSKVFKIGQAIDQNKFSFSEKPEKSIRNFVHIGRFDPSKDIGLIISVIRDIRAVGMELTLTIIGEPTTPQSLIIAQQIIQSSQRDVQNGWLEFRNSIAREAVISELRNFDCFIHAYKGSLDKSILEATSIGMPVATINQEYLNDFGSWSQNSFPSLTQEVSSLLNLTPEELKLKLKTRRILLEQMHTLDVWIERLILILNNSKLI